MPIIPPQSVDRYDDVNMVLNATRQRLNDAMPTLWPISGKVLGNDNAYTLQALNNAWRKIQDHLADHGYANLTSEAVIYEFPPSGSNDPADQCWLSWQGCFDGQNYYTNPALPADFTHPLKMWERWSGQNAAFLDPPMEKILDGLPSYRKTSGIRFWEWRGDAIWMPGSLQLEDLRIRYVRYLADFSDVGDVQWFTQKVPIMRASDSLSWFMCYEMASSRGEMVLAQTFMKNAIETVNHIFNLDVRANQRVNIRRQPRSGRAGRNSTGGWGGWC